MYALPENDELIPLAGSARDPATWSIKYQAIRKRDGSEIDLRARTGTRSMHWRTPSFVRSFRKRVIGEHETCQWYKRLFLRNVKRNVERARFKANYRYLRISFAARAFSFYDRGAFCVFSSSFFFSYLYIYIYIYIYISHSSRRWFPWLIDPNKRTRLPYIRICSWNIHSRGYQHTVARMSLQRSPVIALVCFSRR